MPSPFHSYPKVYAIGHKAIAGIFDSDVIVEEKVDGSQFSFGKVDGELVCTSRKTVLDLSAPGMFVEAVKSVEEIAPYIPEGWVFRGEYLKSPKHNTLAYDRVPSNHIILFDVMLGAEDYANRSTLDKIAAIYGFETVPVLYEGKIESAAQLEGFLENTSILGGQKIEGVVVKVASRDRFAADGKPLIGKYVSEAFKEEHSGEWRKNNPSPGDVVDNIIERYRTYARWEKAIQHLRDSGNLENSPRDIGALVKEVQQDILSECGEEIEAILMNHFWKKISRGLTAGLPEWYKQRLLESAFEES